MSNLSCVSDELQSSLLHAKLIVRCLKKGKDQTECALTRLFDHNAQLNLVEALALPYFLTFHLHIVISVLQNQNLSFCFPLLPSTLFLPNIAFLLKRIKQSQP